jgi:HK97 family phage portal protein
MGHLALRGNAFCQILANARGEITELLPLHPDRMWIEVLKTGDYRYRYVDQDGVTHYFTRGEIWHLRWMSDDGIVGLSPIQIQREAVGEGLAMQSYSSRFYANDARPGGWIEYPHQFADDTAKEAFKQSWQKAYGGKNQRKVAVLERGMKYHELSLSNDDAQFIESRKEKSAEIPRIWGIPPHKVGVLDKATFSNIEQQNIEFWTDTMMPWGKMWSDSIDCNLAGPDSGLDAEFDAKPMMRGDGAARATRIRSLILSGAMTRNEGREEEGLDPINGLDRPLVPVNMGILGEDGEVEVPGAEAGAEDPEMPGAPDDGSGERLQAILQSSTARLARRAAGQLAKKPAAEVFDADFAALVADSLGVTPARAAVWCGKLRTADVHTPETIERSLMACAIGA